MGVVPGVAYTLDNLGLGVGAFLLAEGAGFVGGEQLATIAERLKNGSYAGLVCPLSMKDAKPGEAARQVAGDTGASVIYTRFLDADPDADTFLSQASYNAAVLTRPPGPGGPSLAPRGAPEAPSRPQGRLSDILLAILVVSMALVIMWFGVSLSNARKAAIRARAAGIFDDEADVEEQPPRSEAP